MCRWWVYWEMFKLLETFPVNIDTSVSQRDQKVLKQRYEQQKWQQLTKVCCLFCKIVYFLLTQIVVAHCVICCLIVMAKNGVWERKTHVEIRNNQKQWNLCLCAVWKKKKNKKNKHIAKLQQAIPGTNYHGVFDLPSAQNKFLLLSSF